MTLGSLFDGIGAFPLAGQNIGIEPVWASEILPGCISITKRHFPNMKHLGDIANIAGGGIEPVDIITWGWPCQSHSIGGKRAGLAELNKSGLFYEAIRVIQEMLIATNYQYPKAIVAENVPGLLSSTGGKDFRIVMESMQNLGKGFLLDANIFDSQYMGVPQRRRRVFIVGINTTYIERWPEYDKQSGQANTDSDGQLMLQFDNHADDNISRIRAAKFAVERYIGSQPAPKIQPKPSSGRWDIAPCQEQGKEYPADIGSGVNQTGIKIGIASNGKSNAIKFADIADTLNGLHEQQVLLCQLPRLSANAL